MFLYVRGLQAGTDFGLWIQMTLGFIQSIFKSKPKIKVTYKKKETAGASKSSGKYSSPASSVEQEEIDRILDKISEKGYESLSKDEKQKLFNASKK